MTDANSTPTDRPRTADWFALAALALGGLATVLLVLGTRAFELDRFFVPKELALHATVLVAAVALWPRLRAAPFTTADRLLLGWLGLSALSALLSGNPYLGFRAWSLSASGVAMFWCARALAAAGLGARLAGLMAACVVVGAGTALAQAYGVKLEFASLSRAPGGTFGNRNFMAHLTAFGVPLLIWGVLAARRSALAWLSIAALGACAAALVLSRTRAAWLALAVWGAVTVVVALSGPTLVTPTARLRAVLAIGALIAGLGGSLVLPNALDWKSDNPYLDSVKGVVNYKEGSGQGRLKQYANSLKLTLAHPLLGVGPGNWPAQYPAVAPANDPSLSDATGMTSNPWPSSDWMAALSERGPLATALLGFAIVSLLVAAWRARRDAATPEARLAAITAGGILLLAAIEGSFDAVLLLPMPTFVAWAVVGALLPAPEASSARPMPTWVVALLMLSTLNAAVASTLRIRAMAEYGTGTLKSLTDAARHDPASFRIRLRLAETYQSRGDCASAKREATIARDQMPKAPAPRRVLAVCR